LEFTYLLGEGGIGIGCPRAAGGPPEWGVRNSRMGALPEEL